MLLDAVGASVLLLIEDQDINENQHEEEQRSLQINCIMVALSATLTVSTAMTPLGINKTDGVENKTGQHLK